jgi:hypothetical protein
MAQLTSTSESPRVKKHRQPYTNATLLARYLGVPNAAAIVQIMNNPKDGFAQAYEEFYRNYYKPEVEDNRSLQSSAAFTRYNAPNLHKVVDALEAGWRLGRMKYDVRLRSQSQKQGWNEVDHCAKFLFDVSEWHTTRPAGLWFRKRVGIDVAIDEIYEKIWQMYLRENYLRERMRKADFVRRFNGGGPKASARFDKGDEEEDKDTTSSDDKNDVVISKTNGGIFIICSERVEDGDTFALDNVADMTYKQLCDTVVTMLPLERGKRRIASLTRDDGDTKITDINFDNYKHVLLTQVDYFDYVRLETAAAHEVECVGEVAVDATAHIADMAAALRLRDDEMELDVQDDHKLEDEAVEVL